MKIIGIGKNYVNEMSEKPEGEVTPLIFTKPDSSLLENDEDLVLPSISDDVWYEVEIAFRVGKKCKGVKAADALDYIDALTVANDLTAKDVLKKSREPNKGPWALAKGFDGATPIAAFQPVSDFADLNDINFSLTVNGVEKQKGNTSLMITSLAKLIEYVSAYMTLNPGDILLTGTPAHGVEKINSGDLMEGYLEGKKLLVTKVK
ncbi:fumarylacetoacetate hydrolase family protein [Flammeovirgaceae bacterium SG7u.111]|nr:fumarylacetoacetate hydrolase family protein [Flammeovirgaceae bacterium SG7u.132]WPO37585.1 fumarylacetoacetate hydrolase family protein [Flammeovirgaceae bacterium SG7u.111]